MGKLETGDELPELGRACGRWPGGTKNVTKSVEAGSGGKEKGSQDGGAV